LNGFKWVLNGE